jgi:glycosyltransferase involved in cell wall biosynthesis
MKITAENKFPSNIDEVHSCLKSREEYPIRATEINGNAARQIKTLLIGPLPPPFGGTTVSFQELVRDLKSVPEIHIVRVINTEADRRIHVSQKIVRLFRLIYRVFESLRLSDVVLLNASNRRAIYLGAFLALIVRFFNKKIVIRVFGGELHRAYASSGFLFRSSAKFVFSRCTILLQTRNLMEFFHISQKRSSLVWFPTNRNMERLVESQINQERSDNEVRFIFAGAIGQEKGMDTLLAAFSLISDSRITIDLFGEPMPSYTELWGMQIAKLPRNMKYKGQIDSDALHSQLNCYDCLLLPTRWSNEGYPGIIIEAFGAGLPVIASRIGPIPEIVDESCGLLVDPEDVKGWVDAIMHISQSRDLRRKLSLCACERGKAFDSRFWNWDIMPRVLNSAK